MNPGTNQDIVLGMTLAEIFLLLMFVVWWSTAIEANPEGNVDATVDAATLEARLKSAAVENERLTSEVEALQARLEILREMLGAPDATEEGLKRGLTQRVDEAKRGRPMCAQNNVLVHVELLDGEESVTLVRETSEFFAQPMFTLGRKLVVAPEIEQFRDAVKRYYLSHNCRFDYRLTYKTDSDYRFGRTRYESEHFYNAGITKVR